MRPIADAKRYLLDPSVKPSTQNCRLKTWAHDNAFTMYWLHIVEIVLLAYLVFFK